MNKANQTVFEDALSEPEDNDESETANVKHTPEKIKTFVTQKTVENHKIVETQTPSKKGTKQSKKGKKLCYFIL